MLLEILLSMSIMLWSVQVLLAWPFWHDRAFDGGISWSMVHWFIVEVEYFPYMLVGIGVVILVCEEFRTVGNCWWNWQVWPDGDGLQDGVVGGVADWCFGEYFD